MTGYAIAYRIGVTPWERYSAAAAGATGALLDREEAERSRPLGRALDLGCGRGLHTAELARRGWEAVGVDLVPRAVEAAARTVPGARFVVGNVTALSPDELGRFDLLLDVGVGRDDVATAFPGREVLSVGAADTTCLGWPLSRTCPQWYRLRRAG